MPVIEVNHLTKEYRLGALQSLRQTAQRAVGRLLNRPVEGPPHFKALDDVSFSVEPGEVVGIIGHNGAGKSTLLKMLARISTPTRGSVKVNGRIAPLIEVGAGFVGDFTGRENVYLNAAILGMSRKEISRKFDDIVDFAEMADFIDTPVKRYSSGMQVKLAFAVATSIESEILIVDEVLAVGDLAFQRKCFDRLEDLIKRQGRTVLLVSHNIRQVERICTRVLVMEHGRCAIDDSPQVACNHFYLQSDKKIIDDIERAATSATRAEHSTGEIHLLESTLCDDTGSTVDRVVFGMPCTVKFKFFAPEPLKGLVFGVGVHTPDLLYVAIDDTLVNPMESLLFDAGQFQVGYHLQSMNLLPGAYAFRVGVAVDVNDRAILYQENLCHFQVMPGEMSRSRVSGQGFFLLGGKWLVTGSGLSVDRYDAHTEDHNNTRVAMP